MHRSFLRLYNNELHHLRHRAAEFARDYPKVAGRLAIDPSAQEACPDPFVERLLEGFAFLTARVQLKLEADFPQFTHSLLETVYPHYLCPTPSLAIVRLEPDRRDPGPPEGFLIPRGSAMRSSPAGGETTCEFRTAHDVRLFPLRVSEGRFYTRDLAQLDLPAPLRGKAAIQFKLQTSGGVKIKTLQMDRLPIHLRGLDDAPVSIFEQIFAHCSDVVIKIATAEGGFAYRRLSAETLQRVGLQEDEALLPYAPRGFEGYRLLHEYFALPQRYLFFELSQLQPILREAEGEAVEVILLLREAQPRLENRIDAKSFELFCTPVINLFPKRLDPISLLDRFSEFHAVPDRTRVLDFEIYQVQEVLGLGTNTEHRQIFKSFYQARDRDLESSAYFATHRVPRTLSLRETKAGAVSSYTGSEVYLSLVDGQAAPYRSELQQLSVSALCTNRHLPLQISTGLGTSDFTLDMYAPVAEIRCVSGPTAPMSPPAEASAAWKVISHLSLNYLSLVQSSTEGAHALVEIMKLYSDVTDARSRKQIEGVRAVTSKGIIRRVETPGPLTFARGLEITVELDEDAFEGSGSFTLGSVLERFFARYTSLNSFTETVIRSSKRGEIIRWPAQPGKRQTI